PRGDHRPGSSINNVFKQINAAPVRLGMPPVSLSLFRTALPLVAQSSRGPNTHNGEDACQQLKEEPNDRTHTNKGRRPDSSRDTRASGQDTGT
ncbi:MAG: hypothetical protein ACKPKO_12520, partial [Candidatus Fonsibacter sp.]